MQNERYTVQRAPRGIHPTNRRASLVSFLSLILAAFVVIAGGAAPQQHLEGAARVAQLGPFTQPVVLTAPVMTTQLPSNFVISLTVSDTTGEGILSYDTYIAYNSAVIVPDGDETTNFGCDKTGTRSANLTITCNIFPDGVLRIGASGTAVPMSGSGVLLNLHFKTAPGANLGDSSFLQWDPNTSLKKLGGSVSNVRNDGSVTLQNPGLLTQAITVTQAAPASAAYGSSFTVAATGGGSGNPVVIAASGSCSGGGNNSTLITMTSGTGVCTITYNQAGNASYSAAPQVTNTTNAVKANASINVTPYNVPYDGASHTATGTATGVLSEDLSALLDLSGTAHTTAGTYNNDPWSFAGNGNYNAANGTVNDAISKANQAINVTQAAPGTAAYGSTFTVSATGGGSGLPVVIAGSGACSGGGNNSTLITMTSGAGVCTITYNQAGNTNYNAAPQVSSATTAQKGTGTITVTPYSVPYNGAAHTATGTATGARGEDLSGLLNLSGTTHTNAGTYNGDAWSFAGDANNNAASGTVNDIIAKANQTISVTQAAPGTAVNGTTFTVSATGGGSGLPVVIAGSGACSGGGNNSVLITMTSGTGVCTVTYNQAGNTNFNSAPQVVSGTDAVPAATMQFASASYIEDESQTAQIAVSRSGDTSGTTTVSFSTVAGGSATAGGSCTGSADYVAVSGQTVTFNPGDLVAYATVQVCPDIATDPNETVNLQISSPAPGAAQVGAAATATLVINDTATQFRSTTPITTSSGTSGSPNPSVINVSGPTVNGGIKLTLYDVQFDTPADLDVLLVGPGGQKFVLLADAGGSTLSNATLTFTDTAGQVVPQAGGFVTGVYEPTSWETPVLSFAGAPPAPYAEPGHTVGGTPSFSSVFGTASPTGNWSLYVRNDGGQPFTAVSSAIAGGWGIQFFTPTAATVQVGGRVLAADGSPVRNARVEMMSGSGKVTAVMSNAFGYYSFNSVMPGQSYTLTAVARGLTFPTRVVTVVDPLSGEDIVANQ